MKHSESANIFAPGEPPIEQNWPELANEMRAVQAYFKQLFNCADIDMYMYDEDAYNEQYLEAATEAGLKTEYESVVPTPANELSAVGWQKLGHFDGVDVWVKGAYAYAASGPGDEWSLAAMYVGAYRR